MVNISLADLGIGDGMPNGAPVWSVRRVLGGDGSGGSDHAGLCVAKDFVASNLGPRESAMYKLTKSG